MELSITLVGATLIMLVIVLLASFAFGTMWWTERKHEAAQGRVRTPRSPSASSDMNAYFAPAAGDLASVRALAARFAPHGIVPQSELPEVAEALAELAGRVSSAAVQYSAFELRPARYDATEAVFVLRVRTRKPMRCQPPTPSAAELGAAFSQLVELGAEAIVSADFLSAPRTTDRAYPALAPLSTPPVVVEAEARV